MDVRGPSLFRGNFEEKSPGFERLIMLCDGIFAIAMTLLVIDIKLEVDGGNLTESNLDAALDAVLVKGFFFLVTFITVAGYWIGHRRLMTYVKRQDGTFTLLTFLYLAFVVFFPVSFNVMIESAQFPAGVMFYTLVLAGCGFSAFFLWAYATWNHRLIDPAVSQHEIVSRSISILLIPVYFCLSLLLLLIPGFKPQSVFYSWVLIPAFARLIFFIQHRSEKHSHVEEAALESAQQEHNPPAVDK